MRLMLVDDDKPVLQLISTFIEMAGNTVLPMVDSREAALLIEGEVFDAFIFDVRMDPPDGFALTRSTRKSAINRNAPIVLITGSDDAGTMREGFTAGATCFLGKPITREKIQNVVKVIHGSVLFGRRTSARVPMETRVECWRGVFRDKHMLAESLNIGEGGMLIEPAGGCVVGDKLTMEFNLPGGKKTLHLRANVVRLAAPDRLAVKFLETSIKVHESIQDYIISRLEG
jgi:CheY-like chemotaxis protein